MVSVLALLSIIDSDRDLLSSMHSATVSHSILFTTEKEDLLYVVSGINSPFLSIFCSLETTVTHLLDFFFSQSLDFL